MRSSRTSSGSPGGHPARTQLELIHVDERGVVRHNGRMNLNPPFDRITIEPGKLGGQPCIRGMRITVRRVLEILATYPDRQELFKDYPDLQEEDLQQALAFAAATVDGTIDLHIDAT